MTASIKKHFFTLSTGNLIGKLLGFARELLIAALWGTSLLASAYCLAQGAIIIIINLLVGETLNAGFVPLLRKKIKEQQDGAYTLQWCVFLLLALISGVLFSLIFFCSVRIVQYMSPGFDEQTTQIASQFLKILSCSIPFYLLGQFFSCREMAHGRFVIQALRPSIQSLGLIAGISLTYIYNSPLLMAWGFVAAYVSYAALGLYRLFKSLDKFNPLPTLRELRGELYNYLKIVYPLLLLPIIIQGAVWAEKAIASMIGTASVASLAYAKFIVESGLNLLAVPLGFIGLSMLSGLTVADARQWLKDKIVVVLLLTVPASMALFVHADKIITVIYARGAFDAESVAQTAAILRWAGVGLWAQVCGYMMMKALNARLMHKLYIFIVTIAMGTQVLFNYLLYSYGNWVLGAAMSLYGLISFLGCILTFKLFSDIFIPLFTMLSGAACYYLSIRLIPFLGDGYIISAIYFIVFWVAWICCIKPLREESISWIRKGLSR